MSEHPIALQVAWQRHVHADLDRFERLVGRHREKHRKYHTVAHVEWVVRNAELLLTETGDPLDQTGGVDERTVIAAALYHDAVYEPRSPARANERASARLARRDLTTLGWPEDAIERTAAMIEGTATHLEPPDTATAILFDADLSVLGADPSGYADYVRNVRAEYSHVDDADWASGRGDVLRSYLDRDPIYATAAGRAHWEKRARANLTAELSGLDGS